MVLARLDAMLNVGEVNGGVCARRRALYAANFVHHRCCGAGCAGQTSCNENRSNRRTMTVTGAEATRTGAGACGPSPARDTR